ncbi:DUF3147 family protein [Paenibacillus sp. PAMC21692]|uniref:DUF3147 family protein n=1 Tax=Paenibacillus sp. PAMC21692 TaxID=2762320 RepID=UPI00164EAC66|nr:DUF3147 family protein [Paenibacillus sp. PAMC21692]QNK58688.1 DUF3147 family protein [Paenibacillus sp. PAMC21692]
MSIKDFLLRFLIGGIAVALSYIASALLPWETLGGIFAAFPAVMVVAVLMVGISQGSGKASEIAKGSVFGMTGCAICVVTVLYALQLTGSWWLSLLLGLISWFIGALTIFELRKRVQLKFGKRSKG